MSLFSKIGSAIKNVVAPVLNTVGKVAAATGIPVVSQIGTLVDKLIPDKVQQSMVQAVQRDGEIKVSEVEKTIATYNPSLSASDIMLATQQATQGLSSSVPSATINDSNSVTNIGMFDKIKAFIGKYKMYVIAGVCAAVLYFGGFLGGNKRGGRRRRF